MKQKQYKKLCELLKGWDWDSSLPANELNRKYQSLIPNNLVILH